MYRFVVTVNRKPCLPLRLACYKGAQMRSYSLKQKVAEDPKVIFTEASNLHGSGDFINAEKMYKKVLKLDPSYVSALYNLSLLVFEQQNLEGAKKYAAKAMKLTNLEPELRGKIYKLAGQVHLQLKDDKKAAQYLQQALLDLPTEQSEIRTQLVQAMVKLNDGDKALSLLRKNVSENPKDAQAWYELGALLQDLNKDVEAVEAFENCLRINPNHVDGLVCMGVSATYAFQEEEQSHPSHESGAKASEKAVSYFEKAIALDPSNSHAHLNLGAILVEFGDDEKGREHFKAALRLNPNDPEIPYSLGNLAQKKGKLKSAAKYFSQVLTLKPDHIDALINLGLVYQEQGEAEISLSYYKKVMALDPTNVSNMNLLGHLYQSIGDLQNSRKTFERAVEIDKKHWISRMNLSFLYKDIGEEAKAKEQRGICEKLYPQAKESFEEYERMEQEQNAGEVEGDKTDEHEHDEDGEEQEHEDDDNDDGDFLGLDRE